MSDLERFFDFDRERAERLAARVVPFEHGVARFRDDLPLSHDLNALSVAPTAVADAATLAEAADRIQGPAGLEHRKVCVGGPLGDALAPGFRDLGWAAAELGVLVHDGRELPASPATEATPEEVEPLWSGGIRREVGAGPETVRQLVAARHAQREALSVRYFAAWVGGRVAAACELFSDGHTGQVENVATLDEFRGRGLGTAVVSAATAASYASGHHRTYIQAATADWPHTWYERLGFVRIGTTWDFVRTPAPLRALRLRTQRLELRLATDAELSALAGVARRGVHPPGEMPFRVPWTDSASEPDFADGFCGFHRAQLAAWSPGDWHLELAVFHDGEPIGVQGIFAAGFASAATVRTGSWLGLLHQGRGIGTEMRAAALELGFRGLGAVVAESTAFADNLQSIRVSEKLGYRVAVEIAEPRHELRFRLGRDAWRTPVEVEIERLEPALPYFGVTSGRSPRSAPALPAS